MKSFLLAGQSNMAGRGDFGEVPEIVNERCFMLRMGRWQRMSEPINPDRAIFGEFHSGVGLSASFADRFAREFGTGIGLIPCADGGTRIKQWKPGEILFDHAVMMTKLAMRTSEFAGILWHQGETDSIDFDAAEYKKDLIETLTSMRSDLGAENLPIVIGEISEKIDVSKKPRALHEVNLVLHEVANVLPLCGIASSEGLGLKSDGIHFSSASCRILGERYFEVYKNIIMHNWSTFDY